jgi:tRNA (adenine37-N6)-methyltransferase
MNWRTCELRCRPIGVIRSPFRQAAGTPIQAAMAGEAEGVVEVFEEWVEGLKDLEGFERIWMLYWFDRAEWDGKLLVTPYLDTASRGVFSTRAPSRPNPIGLSSVRLTGIEHNVLKVQGIDVLDGTPLLDIKPYVPRFDCFEAARAGWLDSTGSARTVADGRFERKNT